jgi:WD40 repeat protein
LEDKKKLNKKRKRNESEDSISNNNDNNDNDADMKSEGNVNKKKKSYKKKNELIFNSKNIQCLVNDSYSNSFSDNTFAIFNSLDNILNLAYSTENYSIIFYNLNDNVKINEIKNAHKNIITNFRHCQDTLNERDLILSASGGDNNLKIWNFNTLECIYNFEKVNKRGYLNSCCFLKIESDVYIITCHYRFSSTPECIKVFNINGLKSKEINGSNEPTVFIDAYHDIKKDKHYIITGNIRDVISYDYSNNKEYHKYNDNNSKYHHTVVVYDKDETTKLIESCLDGNVRIWDFHKGNLLNKIATNKSGSFGVCIWNEEYLLVGCKKSIKIIDIKNSNIIQKITNLKNNVITIKKITHPKYGECLIFQERWDGGIKICIYI